MSSKRRQRRRMCDGKKRHADQAAAVAAVIALGRDKGDRVHSYRCKHCNGWHVGHPPWRVRQSIRDRNRARREAS